MKPYYESEVPPIKVMGIKPFETYEWLERKHYAHRIPNICHAFGLYDKELIGVVTYGIPANKSLNIIAGVPGIELNRLCINDDSPKNSASMLVGRSLQLLQSPLCVISYADINQNHVGYIYQATNFIYTGLSSEEGKWFVNGKEMHRKNIFNTWGTSSEEVIRGKVKELVIIKQQAKHRYLYFIGSKKEKKVWLNNLTWPILPYPKGDTSRYNADHEPQTQSVFDFT